MPFTEKTCASANASMLRMGVNFIAYRYKRNTSRQWMRYTT
jgi:hypothetical protein